jgi:hypothetical protein
MKRPVPAPAVARVHAGEAQASPVAPLGFEPSMG